MWKSTFRRPTPSTRCCRNLTHSGAPRHVKHAHKAKKPDALVLAFQQALLRNPAPGAFQPPPALAPAAAAGRNRRRAKMLMVRKKTKSYANAQGIKAVSTKRPLGVRKR